MPPLQDRPTIPKKQGGVVTASPVSGSLKKAKPKLAASQQPKGIGFKDDLEGGAPEMKPLIKLQSRDTTDVYCVGDNLNILKFEVGSMSWYKIPVENDKRSFEAFDG